MDHLYRRIGTRIRRLRHRRNLLQEDLAESTGLSRGSISNIETGRQQLYVHHLIAIAAALDEPPGELLASTEPPNENSERQRLLDAARDGTTARSDGRTTR